MKTHSGIVAREFIRSGAGVGILPDFAVFADLASGQLTQILPDWQEADERPISAIFPNRDRRPVRATLLIDFFLRSFSDRSPLDGFGEQNARTGEASKVSRRRKAAPKENVHSSNPPPEV